MLKYIRFILIAFVFIFLGTFGTVFCLFRPFNPRNTPLFGHIFAFWGRLIFNLDIEFRNWEKRIPKTPCIFVCNHQSNLDLFTCGAVIYGRTVSIGKTSLRYVPFFGQLYWLAGNILIERKTPKEAMIKMEKATLKAVNEDDMSIWVFPEGTRNPEPELLPFKRGAFQSAIKAQVPILPICVSTYKEKVFLKRWKSGHIIIDVMPPISTKNIQPTDAMEFAQKCRQLMQEHITAMNQEVRK